jgi:hypothetical protein
VRRGRARRLLQGPEEALARRREEERRGAGGARSADPVRGARGRRVWSPAGVGAAASGAAQDHSGGGVADGVQARRTEGAEQGGGGVRLGSSGDRSGEGGREATV